jgi:hypothetical protein
VARHKAGGALFSDRVRHIVKPDRSHKLSRKRGDYAGDGLRDVYRYQPCVLVAAAANGGWRRTPQILLGVDPVEPGAPASMSDAPAATARMGWAASGRRHRASGSQHGTG